MGHLRRTFLIAAATAASCAVAPAGQAAVIINGDFETAPTSPNAYGYTYSQTGTSTQTNGKAATGGNPGAAWQVVGDFTNAGGSTFYGMGAGFQTFTNANLTPPVSATEFTAAMDFSLSGVTAGVATVPVQMQLQFQVPGGTNVWSLEKSFNYNAATGGYQHFVASYVDTDTTAGSAAAVAANYANINVIQLNVNIVGDNAFGFDAGNTAMFDNVLISQTPAAVPEPASVSLVALGAGTLFLRRRRRS